MPRDFPAHTLNAPQASRSGGRRTLRHDIERPKVAGRRAGPGTLRGPTFPAMTAALTGAATALMIAAGAAERIF